jgi:phenylalanyl-tRNA synthetase beta chain
LRQQRVNRVLGIEIASEKVIEHLTTLGMSLHPSEGGWLVKPPSWRFDIKIEEDLIEEVARLHGYDNIPPVDASIAQQLSSWTEAVVRNERIADVLIARGYQEAITYSFVDPQWQSLMFPGETTRTLLNAISAELSAMRLSLWPGLALAARENLRRQQARVRFFEVGRKFVGNSEIEVIAGLVVGAVDPEQWAVPNRKVDFFDIKADVEAMLALTDDASVFAFKSDALAALHPGQTARIFRNVPNNAATTCIPVGWVGAIHPEVAKKMDLTYPVYVFELEVQTAFAARLPQFVDVSRFPAIRRDLAVIVDEAVQFDHLAQAVRTSAGRLLNDLWVLSVYRGEQLDKGKKSIALGLNLQDTSRTLTDEDADRVLAQVINHLRVQLGGAIRDK